MPPIPVRPSSLLRHEITAEPDAPARAPIKRALLVGACGKPADGVQPLKGPHKDAMAMSQLLQDKYCYMRDDITLLLDDNVHVDPTEANIMASLDALVRDIQAGDRLFFYFAGHSGQVDTKNPEEEDGMDEHIVSSDGIWIQDDTLYDHLIRPLPFGCIFRAVIDACHSGSLLDLTHSVCNRVYVPWISKGGKRKPKTLQYRTVRQHAVIGSPPKRGRFRRSSSGHASTRLSMPSVGVSQTDSEADIQPITGETSYWFDAIMTSSPTEFSFHPSRGTASPERLFCDGVACFGDGLYNERIPACTDILCLSSSRDEQKTWENKDGDSMTSILVDLLRDNPRPSLHLMMTHLSHKVYENCIDMQLKAREYQKDMISYREKEANKLLNPVKFESCIAEKERGTKRKRSPVPTKTLSVDTINFQDPELSSAIPVKDMETRLWDM